MHRKYLCNEKGVRAKFMDIRQLKYFRSIVAEDNITEAAKRLFMTQPSLSYQLQLLENELSVKLVHRGSRKVTVTEAGRLLNDRAGQILDLINTTVLEVKELHEGYTGTLSIGAIASSGVTLLPGLIRDFHFQFPNIIFQLFEGDTPKILELLKSGIIEIGIIRAAFDRELYNWIDLPTESMIAAMSPKWSCGDQPHDISINELAHKPLLVHRSNEMLIADCCQRAGFQPKIICKGDDVRSLLVLADEGIGLAIVPKSALGLVPGNNIIYREIRDSSLEIKKAIIWVRQRFLSAAAKHFIDTFSGSAHDNRPSSSQTPI
jgi:LysR family transcriptional regulator, salicylic acid-responsive activator of bsdBCD